MNRIEFLATYYGKQHQELKTLEELEELTTELINNIRTEGVSSNTPSEILIRISSCVNKSTIEDMA